MSIFWKLSGIALLVSTVSCIPTDFPDGTNATDSEIKPRFFGPNQPKYLGRVGTKTFFLYDNCDAQKTRSEAKEMCESFLFGITLGAIENGDEATFVTNRIREESRYWTAAMSTAAFIWDTPNGGIADIEKFGVIPGENIGARCGAIRAESQQLYFDGASCSDDSLCGVLCQLDLNIGQGPAPGW